MAVLIQESSNVIEAGIAKLLFETKLKPPTTDPERPRTDYAVMPDGQRFLVLLPA